MNKQTTSARPRPKYKGFANKPNKPKTVQPQQGDAGDSSIHGLKQRSLDYVRPYYRGDDSGAQKPRYVLWVDIMGSQGKMLRNVHTAAIPLMKLHVAALAATKKTVGNIELFPVIDGIYAVSEHFGSLAFFLSDVFRSMAAEFLVLKNWERSIVRGAVAYGPVILGRECKDGALLLKESDYANAILLGMPLVQAYTDEKKAPPFGVFVHESVRAFGQMREQPIKAPLWRWWTNSVENSKIAAALLPSLKDYFEWCQSNPVYSGYPPDRIEAHRVLANEYLGGFKDGWTAGEIPSRRKPATEPKKAYNNLSGSERQIKKLGERLHLTGEQIEQIRPVLENREAALDALRQDHSLDHEARRLKILNIVADSKNKIQSLLDKTQQEAFIESEQAHSAIQEEE